MAWQNSIGMGPGSAGTPASSNEAPGNVAQPQGTEYTLQGEHATTGWASSGLPSQRHAPLREPQELTLVL